MRPRQNEEIDGRLDSWRGMVLEWREWYVAAGWLGDEKLEGEGGEFYSSLAIFLQIFLQKDFLQNLHRLSEFLNDSIVRIERNDISFRTSDVRLNYELRGKY